MKRAHVCLILVGCVVSAALGCGVNVVGGGGEKAEAFPKLSPPVSSKADADGLVTQARPMVARLAVDDPMRVVLHWETEKGPITRQTSRPVSWTDTVSTLTFHVTSPDGKKHDLKVKAQA